MNILHITKYSMLKGGVAKVIKELATRTIENGDNAIVLSSCTEDHNNCVDGIQLLHEDFPTPGVHFFRNRRLLDKIVGICKQYNVDIIHCHGAYRAGFVGYLVKKRTSIPYIVTSHGDLHPMSKRTHKKVFRRRIKKVLKSSAFVTHLCEEMKESTNKYQDQHESQTIRNGIDLKKWGRCLGHDVGKYILYVGRLEKEKGVDVLLNAYKLLPKEARIPLLLLGDGSERENLRQLAVDLGLEIDDCPNGLWNEQLAEVSFQGWVDENRLHEYYHKAQLVVVPSRFESFGLVLLEAMASGKALVVSDIPVFNEILTQGRNAEMAKPCDSGSFALKIKKLICDPTLRTEYETNNRKDVQCFDWDVIFSKYFDIYRKVVEKKRIK